MFSTVVMTPHILYACIPLTKDTNLLASIMRAEGTLKYHSLPNMTDLKRH